MQDTRRPRLHRALLLAWLASTAACVIPRETASSPQGVPDRAELGFETGVALPDCDGCSPGARFRLTGLYRTAPEIPIAVGGGIEYARFHYTYEDRYDSWPKIKTQVQQFGLQLLGRYYMWSEPLGARSGGSEGWLDLGVGYDSLGSNRREASACDLSAPLVVAGGGAGYRLAHNVLLGVGASLDARFDPLPVGQSGTLETPPCREVPDRMAALGQLTLMTRISF